MRAARQLIRALAAEGTLKQTFASASGLAEAPQQLRASLGAAGTQLQQQCSLVLAAAQQQEAEGAAGGVAERQQGPGTAAAAAAPGSSSSSSSSGAAASAEQTASATASAGQPAASAAAAQQQQQQQGGTASPRPRKPWQGPRKPWQGPRRPQGEVPAAGAAAQRYKVPRKPPRDGQQQQQRRRRGPPPARAGEGRGGKWWQHFPVKEQDKPDRLVPILMHHTDTCEEVLDLVRRYESTLSARELTVACRRMGLLFTEVLEQPRRPLQPGAQMVFPASNNHEQCAQLFKLATPFMERNQLDSHALATALWMCSRFHYTPPGAERGMWEAAVWARRHEVNLIETGNIFFSLGVLHWAPERAALLEELADRVLDGRAAGELSPWVVCNIMWGCARLLNSNFHPGPQRLVALMEACLPKLSSFVPESFCALLFSLACMRVRPDDAALTAILDAFEWHVDKCSNRQLVTTVWSMGALQIGPLLTDRLWNLIEDKLLKQANDFNFSSAPLFLFGAARMGMGPSEEVLRLLLSKAREYRSELRTGDVAVILWALPRLGYRVRDGMVEEDFVESMVERFLEHNRQQPATLRHISALLWATTSLKFRLPPDTVSAILADAERLAKEARSPLTTTDANMLLSAFEELGSAEGLAFLKRHLIGGSEGEEDELGDDMDVRPSLSLQRR